MTSSDLTGLRSHRTSPPRALWVSPQHGTGREHVPPWPRHEGHRVHDRLAPASTENRTGSGWQDLTWAVVICEFDRGSVTLAELVTAYAALLVWV